MLMWALSNPFNTGGTHLLMHFYVIHKYEMVGPLYIIRWQAACFTGCVEVWILIHNI